MGVNGGGDGSWALQLAPSPPDFMKLLTPP